VNGNSNINKIKKKKLTKVKSQFGHLGMVLVIVKATKEEERGGIMERG